ncbi:hypothetical protein ACHAXT_005782 [Thalassiosira profunda]
MLNLLFLTALLPLTHAKRQFPADRVAIQHAQRGGMVRFCLDGKDCSHMMQMKLSRLYEVDDEGGSVGNNALNFNTADYVWEDPEYVMDDANNTLSVRQKIEARVGVGTGKPSDWPMANFTLTTEVFYADAVVEYGNATLNATAGALKFSIEVADWPWKDDNKSNGLKFGVRLKVKTREGNEASDNPPRLELDGGGNATIERLELGDGMHVDSPDFCILDYGEGGSVTTSVEPASDEDGISIDWRFPHFDEHLYYDPLLGDDSVDFQAVTAEDSGADGGEADNGGGGDAGSGDGDDRVGGSAEDDVFDGASRPATMLSCSVAALLLAILQ